MKLKELYSILNEIAPFFLQEEYDNSGLQFGDWDSEITKILLATDLTQDTVLEAKENLANTMITHHPVMFKPIKSIEKKKNPALFEAITNSINIISFHTNFDLAEEGLNDYFLKILGLKKIKPIIESKENVYKIVTFVPEEYVENVRNALFEANCGHIGKYDRCSFVSKGLGTFRPLEGTNPFIGTQNKEEHVNEFKVEVVVRERDLNKALTELKNAHPYEEPAIDVFKTIFHKNYGIGAISIIDRPIHLKEFIETFKRLTYTKYVRVIGDINKEINKIAVCTGGCSSLIDSIPEDVDLFITGDINYHTAINILEKGITTLDVEHFETEKFFKEALKEKLDQCNLTIDVILSKKEKSPFLLF
ncbi:MAG: Nif3-like dinuclear metal center hexameric protein [Caldisericaceae bacterium]